MEAETNLFWENLTAILLDMVFTLKFLYISFLLIILHPFFNVG